MKKSQDKLRKTSMWRGRDGLHILCEVTHTKASGQVQLKRGSERDKDVYMDLTSWMNQLSSYPRWIQLKKWKKLLHLLLQITVQVETHDMSGCQITLCENQCNEPQPQAAIKNYWCCHWVVVSKYLCCQGWPSPGSQENFEVKLPTAGIVLG